MRYHTQWVNADSLSPRWSRFAYLPSNSDSVILAHSGSDGTMFDVIDLPTQSLEIHLLSASRLSGSMQLSHASTLKAVEKTPISSEAVVRAGTPCTSPISPVLLRYTFPRDVLRLSHVSKAVELYTHSSWLRCAFSLVSVSQGASQLSFVICYGLTPPRLSY